MGKTKGKGNKNAKKTTLNVELKEHLTIQAFLTRNKQ